MRVLRRAPLGDPSVYQLRGYRLCLRRADAAGHHESGQDRTEFPQQASHPRLAVGIEAHGAVLRLKPLHGHGLNLAAQPVGGFEEGDFHARRRVQATIQSCNAAPDNRQVIMSDAVHGVSP